MNIRKISINEFKKRRFERSYISVYIVIRSISIENEQEIEVKKGRNTLTIVAVDKNGNSKKEEKDILGASKPKISVGKSGGELVIKVTDDDEVTKVEYNLNGTDYTKENTNENKKEFEIRQALQQGENKITIKAYNKSGLVQEFSGKCNY